MNNKTIEEYAEEISNQWDWLEMQKHLEINTHEEYTEGVYYLGTVFNLFPSGKYYMPWCTNFSLEEASEDEKYREALEKIAQSFDGYIENGEGDPCDVYFCKLIENEME